MDASLLKNDQVKSFVLCVACGQQVMKGDARCHSCGRILGMPYKSEVDRVHFRNKILLAMLACLIIVICLIKLGGDTNLHLSNPVSENYKQDAISKSTSSNVSAYSQDSQISVEKVELAVKSFLEKGGDPDTRMKDGQPFSPTVLHLAVEAQQPTIVKMLLEYKANPNLEDEHGVTPLMLSSNLEISKMLIKAGADVDKKDHSGQTYLHRSNDLDIVKFIIDAGADVNIQDNTGQTPMHIWCNYPEIVNMLINAGGDESIADDDGNTPLHLCKDPIATKLLAKETVKEVKNKQGKTPFQIHFKDKKLAKILLETYYSHFYFSPINVNFKDSNGETPLNYWSRRNDSEMVALLRKHGAK